MKKSRSSFRYLVIALGLAGAVGAEPAAERTECFDRGPGWEGRNNRALSPAIRTIRQDFGYSATHHAGGAVGEIGGFMTPAAEPAYYARKIPTKTLEDPLTASGRLAGVGRQFHVLLGFFNANTLGAWRTPNTLALRLYGRGEVFYAFVEYASQRWRAGGDSPRGFVVRDPETGREKPWEFAGRGAVHTWSLTYDPHGHDGHGTLTATLDDQTAICHLDPGHQGDGAIFNRFGLLTVMKHADEGGEVWLDEVTVNGQREHFHHDPGWDSRQNRHTYTTSDVRPRFDFGFSLTHFAQGQSPGELGGLVFRGDGRYPDKIAYYGARLSLLTLSKPLKAGGKVCLRRAVSDSTTLIGFFHSSDSTCVEDSQASALPENFLGVAIEGPSREGFFFYPAYRLKGGGEDTSRGTDPPRIYPDGSAHDWSLEYTPPAAGERGRIVVTLDGESSVLVLETNPTGAQVRFERFGLITTRIDGNGQYIYFDDLSYTFRQGD